MPRKKRIKPLPCPICGEPKYWGYASEKDDDVPDSSPYFYRLHFGCDQTKHEKVSDGKFCHFMVDSLHSRRHAIRTAVKKWNRFRRGDRSEYEEYCRDWGLIVGAWFIEGKYEALYEELDVDAPDYDQKCDELNRRFEDEMERLKKGYADAGGRKFEQADANRDDE